MNPRRGRHGKALQNVLNVSAVVRDFEVEIKFRR